MRFFSQFFQSDFFIRLKSWEYWPFGILQAPLFPYWLWLSLKARSFVFFSASNPGILMGGMFGESKFDVLQKIPGSVKPKTILIHVPSTVEEVMKDLGKNGLDFPLIFKPDLGERGWMVRKISAKEDIITYLEDIRVNFLAQSLVDLPLEFGVFYIRYPNHQSGKVTSVVKKQMLTVRGDGSSTLQELIHAKERAKLQWNTLRKSYHSCLTSVIPQNETIELVSIGNHCLGTKFIDANHLINEKLSVSFDRISKQIEGFYFGRFDLRAASVEDLEEGKVQIMELNGCGAEPSHIYQPGFSILKAIQVLFRHWKDIYIISRQNHNRGVPYISFQEARTIYKRFKKLTEPTVG